MSSTETLLLPEGHLPDPLYDRALTLIRLPAILSDTNAALLSTIPLVQYLPPHSIHQTRDRVALANLAIPKIKQYIYSAILDLLPPLTPESSPEKLIIDQSPEAAINLLSLVSHHLSQSDQTARQTHLPIRLTQIALARTALLLTSHLLIHPRFQNDSILLTYHLYFLTIECALVGARTNATLFSHLDHIDHFGPDSLEKIMLPVRVTSRTELTRLQATALLNGHTTTPIQSSNAFDYVLISASPHTTTSTPIEE